MSKYVTAEDARSHLRVDFHDDDTYIQGLCDMAEAMVGMEIGEDLDVVRKVIYYGQCDTTADSDQVDIGRTWTEDELVGYSITLDLDEEETHDITANTTAGVLTLDDDVGETDTDVEFRIWETGIPLPLKHAILLLIGHLYMLREPVVVGVNVSEVPMSFKYLLAPYKNWTVR